MQHVVTLGEVVEVLSASPGNDGYTNLVVRWFSGSESKTRMLSTSFERNSMSLDDSLLWQQGVTEGERIAYGAHHNMQLKRLLIESRHKALVSETCFFSLGQAMALERYIAELVR